MLLTKSRDLRGKGGKQSSVGALEELFSLSRWPSLDRSEHRRSKSVLPGAAFSKCIEKAMRDSRDLLDVRKQMKKRLHDDKNRFRASLVATFGQPIAQRSRDFVLLTQAVQVKDHKVSLVRGRPPESIPYVVVDQHFVPITFPLFKALRDVVAGLHDASLSAEIFALLNGVKSLVSGHVVRDVAILEEDTTIELGNSGQTIEIVGGSFRFVDSKRL